jgi:hypothetical protein
MIRCPGQDQRFWKPEDIFEVRCPGCGRTIEFFKDEPKLKCPKCGHIVANPRIDIGCAEWCQYAENCLGASNLHEVNFIRDKLIDQMKKVFAEDKKRIEHALAVLNYAEKIRAVEGGNPLVVKAAAILHDIGIHEAERKYGSAVGRYQEIEGPPISKRILQNYDIPAEAVKHICRIIANHHSAKDIDTTEFKILWDADYLVNIPDNYPNASKEKLQEIIDKTFKTHQGHKIAIEQFCRTKSKVGVNTENCDFQ